MKPIRLIACFIGLSLITACQLPSSTSPTQTVPPGINVTSADPTLMSPVTQQPTEAAINSPLPPVPTMTEAPPTATLMSLATMTPTETPAITSTEVLQATATNLPPTATTSNQSISTSTPTLTTTNVIVNTGQSVTKVRFPYLSTGVQITGNLPANQSQTYLLRSFQDQSFLAKISTNNNDLVLALRRENGQLITPVKDEGNNYEWLLPASEEYRLEVIGTGQPADYWLQVDIPRVVRFPSGSYGMVEYGRVNPGQTILYRLRATPGQEMTLRLTAPQNSASLGVFGLESGTQILSPDEDITQWRGQLPSGNTHYIVQVTGWGSVSVDYSLEFSIR